MHMIKNYILSIIIGTITILMVWSIWNFKISERQKEVLQLDFDKTQKDWMFYRKLEMESEQIHLDSHIALTKDAIEDTVSLSELINKSPKLIIRYSNINWGMCNSSDFINIENLVKIFGGENIILITAPSRLEDLFTFKEINNINIPVYQLYENRLSIPLEKENIPFLFVTDKLFYTNFILIPDPSMPSILEQYVDIIHNRFFSSKADSRI